MVLQAREQNATDDGHARVARREGVRRNHRGRVRRAQAVGGMPPAQTGADRASAPIEQTVCTTPRGQGLEVKSVPVRRCGPNPADVPPFPETLGSEWPPNAFHRPPGREHSGGDVLASQRSRRILKRVQRRRGHALRVPPEHRWRGRRLAQLTQGSARRSSTLFSSEKNLETAENATGLPTQFSIGPSAPSQGRDGQFTAGLGDQQTWRTPLPDRIWLSLPERVGTAQTMTDPASRGLTVRVRPYIP